MLQLFSSLLALLFFLSGPAMGRNADFWHSTLAAKTEATLFRQGTFADEAIGWEGNYVKGRQWATDNPLTTPNYAQRYGLPAENTGRPDWVVGGRVQGPYTTRPAPPSHNNPLNTGGATEVLRIFLTPYFRPICDRRGLGGMAGLASSLVAT